MNPTSRVKTLKIDGKDVGARSGFTVLEAARENGIEIPGLCHLDGLGDVGACRLCLVEVKGSPKLAPACVTTVKEGMEVFTRSERIDKYRRMILEFFFTERNHVCAVCVANGRCELQAYAQSLGMTHVRLPYLYPRHEVDASHERFALDHNRCILCTRCVRVCDEIEGAHTKDVMGRGTGSRIIHDLNQPWGDAETCTACGKCVQVCPTGALTEKGKPPSERSRRRDRLPYLRDERKGAPR